MVHKFFFTSVCLGFLSASLPTDSYAWTEKVNACARTAKAARSVGGGMPTQCEQVEITYCLNSHTHDAAACDAYKQAIESLEEV